MAKLIDIEKLAKGLRDECGQETKILIITYENEVALRMAYAGPGSPRPEIVGMLECARTLAKAELISSMSAGPLEPIAEPAPHTPPECPT